MKVTRSEIAIHTTLLLVLRELRKEAKVADRAGNIHVTRQREWFSAVEGLC